LFFGSGIGCYFSLNKNPDIYDFYKRRFFRIAPTYICFIILWFVYKRIIGEVSFQMLIGNLFAIQNFTGFDNYFNWYISALLLFYLLAPFFKSFVDRASIKTAILAFAILLVFSLSFWNANTYIITITRIPIFLMGFFVGRLALKNDYNITIKSSVLAIICMVIGLVFLFIVILTCKEFLWSYGLYWYPFILITPGLCLCISYFVFFAQNVKWLNWITIFLKKIGENSFEIYLLHIPFFDVARVLVNKIEVLKDYNNVIWIIAFALMPVIVICLKIYIKIVMSLFQKGGHKSK